MTILKNLAVLAIVSIVSISSLSAQCTNWNNIELKGEAEDAHVVYRPYMKDKTVDEVKALGDDDFTLAFTNWEKAYTLAPAADGGRPTHYIDGITFYKVKSDKTADTEIKATYAAKIQELYDQYLECYPKDNKLILGRKAFDSFYYGYAYTQQALDALEKAMDVAGNESEYILLDPIGQTLTYLYENELIEKEVVQRVYKKAVEYADFNIEAEHHYKEYYESGKANMEASINKIASDVFDCSYFKSTLLPQYEKNKNDWESVNYVWLKCTSQGCEETDPDLVQLKGDYDRLYAIRKDSLDAERRKIDPCFDGLKLQEEEKYSEAMARYQECVNASEDMEVKAQILYSMAWIQTWKLGQYGSANAKAREAASLKSGWGKPYILLGDIISKRATSCDDWNRRLAAIAAIDKYSYARSIDSEVAGDASSRISRQTGALPAREDGFMRKVSEGQTVTVSCVGETVKVRFRD